MPFSFALMKKLSTAGCAILAGVGTLCDILFLRSAGLVSESGDGASCGKKKKPRELAALATCVLTRKNDRNSDIHAFHEASR